MAKFSLIYALFTLFFSTSATALTSDYFSSKSNPFVVDFGFEYLHPQFGNIENVVIRNYKTGGIATPVSGSVDQVYPDVFAQTLNGQFLLSEESKATLIVKSFLPLNSLAQMDTGNTNLPEYVLYRAENQRPRMMAMGEMNLSDSWRAGLGFDLGFGVSAEATIYLQSGAGKYSSQRISASIRPKFIPLALIEHEGYRLLVKGENKIDFAFKTNAGASVFSTLSAGFDVSYSTNSALFFDPWTFELSKQYGLSAVGLDTWNLGLGISYQLWTGYQARAAVIEDVSGTFSNGLAPAFKTRNLLVPRVSLEKRFQSSRWELGYQFKDSIFNSTPSGNGNYLDPPRHTGVIGAIFPISSGWEFGANLQVARLTPQSVVKSDATDIGGPGYEALGWLYGGSVNLIVPFSKKD
jgi:hypothetical protein